MDEERPGKGRREPGDYPRRSALLLPDSLLIWLAVLPAAERGRVVGALIAAFWGEGHAQPPESEPETPQGRAAVDVGLMALDRDAEKWRNKCDQRQAAAEASAAARRDRAERERAEAEKAAGDQRAGAPEIRAPRTPRGLTPDRAADNIQKAKEKASIAELLADEWRAEP